MIAYEWRGPFTDAEVSALHAEGFGHEPAEDDWRAQVERHSLGWVCARDGTALAGFVNVAWDGDVHAFILDTLVAAPWQRHGIGTRLVAVAAEDARAGGLRVAARRLRGSPAPVLLRQLRVHAHQRRTHRPVSRCDRDT